MEREIAEKHPVKLLGMGDSLILDQLVCADANRVRSLAPFLFGQCGPVVRGLRVEVPELDELLY